MASNGTDCVGSTTLRATVSVVLTALMLVTVAGNVVVCLAVGLDRRLRSLTNCFIVSLAVTDLLLGLLVLPFSALHQLTCEWHLGRAFCDVYTSLDVMLCTASILHLVAISLDRYCAVTAPLRYPVLVTPGRVGLALALIWVVSITLSFLAIHLGWNSRAAAEDAGPPPVECKVQVNPVYGLVDGLLTFYLPLLVLCATYYRVFRIAREQARRIHRSGGPWRTAPAASREHKATVTLAAVVGAFVVCWLPYFTVFVYRGLRGDQAVNPAFEAVVLWLGYANSALNPVLYAALNRDFREAYRRLLRCPPGRPAPLPARSSRNETRRRLGGQARPRQQPEERPLRLQVWGGGEGSVPPGAPDRKPALFCSGCSSDLLSCCKSLWGLGFLQRPSVPPPEEQPLPEEAPRTPGQKAMRMLPPEAV
ncbi:histamine H2 receptor [Erinaceus europaeus]|uniref:Histamine H2 receptor n=1 Tax=Erinaceus europaeus TaxID=9365 RepID=A0ABM3XWI8_ERIEU|nr:histamine H2 receptor [Erinaceus europaeus]XP_060053181.1 histamine H2 receptor [Erinaceus europaeus]